MEKVSVVGLIPARGGSLRVPDKNIRPLAAHPLIAYTIRPAIDSNIFQDIIVSTDSRRIADVARYYEAEVPFLRPAEIAGPWSRDIEWVEHALAQLKEGSRTYDCFSILRPTNPFRKPETIQRAWQEFLQEKVDSLRAVEECTQHPGKMWILNGKRIHPLLPDGPKDKPWYSTPYQALPTVYIQNASLEIAWTRVVDETHTIAGKTLMPFLTHGEEGFDINNEYDWFVAEEMIRRGQAKLPYIEQEPCELRDNIQ